MNLSFVKQRVVAVLVSLLLILKELWVEGFPTQPSACGTEQYRATNGSCLPCKKCPKGQQPVLTATCSATQNTVCEPCPVNTWSDVESVTARCNVCTSQKKHQSCPLGERIRYCTLESDTTCDFCGEGSFYYAAGDGCLWCRDCSDRQYEVKPCTYEHDRMCKKRKTMTLTTSTTLTTLTTLTTPTTPTDALPSYQTITLYDTTQSATLTTSEPTTSGNSDNTSATAALAVGIPILIIVLIGLLLYVGCNWPWAERNLNETSSISNLKKKTQKGLVLKMAITHVNSAVDPRTQSTDRVCAIWLLVKGTGRVKDPCFQQFATEPPTVSQEVKVRDVARLYLRLACTERMTFGHLNSLLLRYELDEAAAFLREQLPEKARGILPTIYSAAETRPPVVNQEGTPPGLNRGSAIAQECTGADQTPDRQGLLLNGNTGFQETAAAESFSSSPRFVDDTLSRAQQNEDQRWRQQHSAAEVKGHVVRMPSKYDNTVDGDFSDVNGADALPDNCTPCLFVQEQTENGHGQYAAQLARVAACQSPQSGLPLTSQLSRSSTTSPLQEHGHFEEETGEATVAQESDV